MNKHPRALWLFPALLAALCSLMAITAVPASAGIVVVNSVTVSPATAGSVAGYTANVTLPLGASSAPGDTITITFPDEVTLPATVSYQAVSINGVAYASSDAAPYVSGQSLVLTLNAAQASAIAGSAGPMAKIVISPAAGIRNPAIAKTAASASYMLSVVTSRDTTSGSIAYGIIPSYSISPTSGDRTTEVTVTGQGWAPNLLVTISNGLTGVGMADADGAFTLTATAGSGNGGAVNCADGAGQTQAGGSVTWDSTVTVPIYILKARITVSPTSGNVGSTFYVDGYDFTSGGTIASASVTLANTAVNANAGATYVLTTRDAYGTLDDAYIACTVPTTMSGGAKRVSVTDSGGRTATRTFTVNTPTMTIDPASGTPNTLVTVTGSNFKANDTIAIGGLTFAGWTWNTAAITIDSSGSWIYSTKVPASAVAGTNPVIVISASGTTASAVFTASARALTLSPSSGPKGTKVTVTGSNMTPNGSIPVCGLRLGGICWNTDPIPIDSSGNLSPTTLEVPTSATVGANTVAAVDSGSLAASAVFTVTQPTISISPTSGYKGQTLTVAGAGWVPGSLGLVTVTFNAVTRVASTPKADGTFIALFTVPVTAWSGQLVGASDAKGNSAASVAFLISDPSISIEPASGPPGTIVTVTGQGFQPQSAVTALTIGGASVLPTIPLITDTTGSFTSTFTVPGFGPGAQAVSATVHSMSASTSFNVSETPPSASTQLATISGELIRVWGWTASTGWQMYDPADPIGSDLASLVNGRGYWVKVTGYCTLVYGGYSWNLTAGWNLIGWVGTDLDMTDADSDSMDAGLQLPCRFHGVVQANGAEVPDGTLITAKIDGDVFSSVTPSPYGDSTFWLEISPPAGTDYAEGEAITFSVGGYPADQVGQWEAGGNLELSLEASVVYGDANADGVVDGRDVIRVRKIILGLLHDALGSDVNGDGTTDGRDVIRIKKMILGIDEHRPE